MTRARFVAQDAARRDAESRERIRTELDVNFLVEAGAGSGKTTSLVARLCALVERGTAVESIAAVTFTRKAANELRERFQIALEEEIRKAPIGSGVRARFERARRDIDRAFLGTIHAFCGRLLRERPLEVALDPDFVEVSDEDWDELLRSFWNRWLERTKEARDPALKELRAVGVDARELYLSFVQLVGNPDVHFPTGNSAAPDVATCRRKLEELLDRAERMRPKTEPEGGEDRLMRTVRQLRIASRTHDWDDPAEFCRALETITKAACGVTQNRWGSDREAKAAAKALREDFLALLDGDITNVLRCWREHRYPIVMGYLKRAAEAFAKERHATGQLGFEDLLLLAATLLREHASVRDELGRRWAHLLVDEFQDTDPLQAEVCLLLASDSSEGSDWRRVRPRPGSLFVVGDPKQSIYRFRRADIQIYGFVKERFTAFGEVLSLTRNFRSTKPIESFVNAHFEDVLPTEATPSQAPFSPMITSKEPGKSDGVFRYTIGTQGQLNFEKIMRLDAAMVASWIAARVESGERAPGDFLILTPKKAPIETYARALAERNVPVTTTGAQLVQEYELKELLVVLRAIADPENPILVAAALEGLFFGLSPADLFDAKEAGLHFSITHPPSERKSRPGSALAQLHDWWKLSQQHAADVLLESIIDDTGLLYYAASQELGDARAGALLHLVDALRVASVLGASAITDAMTRIEILLEQEAPDAPLRPGRTDAVRVMNLHKAKGLEAPVVLLVAPQEFDPRDPTLHVDRASGPGTRDSEPPRGATGGMAVCKQVYGQDKIIAQPPRWEAMVAAERELLEAERLRLVYVAATRAMHELVVARSERQLKNERKLDASIWSTLDATLDAQARVLRLTETPAPGRKRVEQPAEELREEVLAAAERVKAASAPSLRMQTVTESAKAQRDEARRYDLPLRDGHGLGAAWGRAVHRAIQAMGRGRSGESLAAFVRAVARDEGLESAQATELESLIARVRASDAWKQLVASGSAVFELPVMRVAESGEGAVLTEGVIDAAALDEQGWRIVDWKSDAVSKSEWVKRLPSYERQVRGYVEMLAALSGENASGKVERVISGFGSPD